MYEVTAKRFNVGTPSEWVANVPTVTFHTAAGLLRWALDTRQLAHGIGGLRYPMNFDEKWLGFPGDGSPGRDYQLVDTFCKYKITADHLEAMRRAQQRYREIVHYLRNVEPEWVEGPEEHYADNSIDRTDTNKYGQTRRVHLLAPGGDACF
jgi:hypothetical protein